MRNRITLEKIEMENFLCFRGTHKFKFHESGTHRIYGRNLDLRPSDDNDESYHNSGSGKSSFLAAVTFGLFGEIAKDINKNSVINKTEGRNCLVAVEFSNGEDTYRIERYRKYSKKGNSLLLFRKNKKKLQDISLDDIKLTQEKIEDIIMMNYDTFMKSGLISRDGTQNFFDLHSYERTKLLESIIRLDKFAPYEKNVREKAARLRKDIDSSVLRISALTSSVGALNSVIRRQIREYKTRKESLQTECDSLNRKIEGMKAVLGSMSPDEAVSRSKEYMNHLHHLQSEISAYNTELKHLKQMKQSVSDEWKSWRKAGEMIRRRNDSLMKLKNSSVKCEHCGKPINQRELDERQKDDEQFIDEMKISRKNSRQSVRRKIKDLRQKKVLLEKSRRSIESEKNKDFHLSPQLKKTVEKNFSSRQRLTVIDELESLMSALEHKKAELKKMNPTAVKETRKHLEADRKKLASEKEVKLMYDRQYKTAEFWISALDYKNDESIKSFILRKIIPVFNVLLHSFIHKAFDGRLLMSFDSSFSESITYNGEAYEFKELSTGERKQINIIINFVILSLVRMNLNSFNTLFLDEIFTSLDSEFIKKIINALNENFMQDSVLYVISHDNIDYLKTDSVIVIQKENKESSILYEKTY